MYYGATKNLNFPNQGNDEYYYGYYRHLPSSRAIFLNCRKT